MIKANKKPIRIFFFLIGIIATLAYRIIIILNFYNPFWVKVSWYVGTMGFILYFWHRFYVQKKRIDLILENDLVKAVEKGKGFTKKQKQALNYFVKSISTSKARWNSLIIFLLSVLALVVGIILDLGIFG